MTEELSTLEKMRAARLAQRRTDYQADITRQQQEADRGDAWANPDPHERFPEPHKPDLGEPFKSFQVLHLIKTKSADGRPNTKAEIGTFEDIKGDVWQSRQMPIEEIKTLPQYVGECWSLVGWTKDSDATTIGDFKTEDMARDVLGGITGDRMFDKHPSQDWTLAVAWSRFGHEDDGFKPSLQQRMTDGFTDADKGRVDQARHGAMSELRKQFADRFPVDGHQDMTPEQKTAYSQYWDKASDRPHEQIAGIGRDRW